MKKLVTWIKLAQSGTVIECVDGGTEKHQVVSKREMQIAFSIFSLPVLLGLSG